MPALQGRLLDSGEAQRRILAHERAVSPYASAFVDRRHRGQKHPVDDFLFTYYSQNPAQLGRWHPGHGVVLTGPAAEERLSWKFYRELTLTERKDAGIEEGLAAVVVDLEAFLSVRGQAVEFSRMILERTLNRNPKLSCFGLHEWAMAYRSQENGHRHEYLDLRLGASGTDRVVEEAKISCTHFDAYRFYAPQAAPLNELRPTRENQRDMEQPGCLHANMDLYKWCYKLTPVLPSELVFECFELAYRVRRMDMQAAPYDLSEWGYEPIAIESASGRAEYVRLQKGFMDEAQNLRRRVLKALPQPEGHA